jgi:hypothetical protein
MAMETLDKHFRELTKAAFARYGFARGDLMAHWPEIAGPELAGCCEPERIRWPRGAGELAQKQGGTLVVRAAPGRALELQHEVPQLLERINRYFGYGAVSAIKVVQSQSLKARPEAPLPVEPAATAPPLEGIAEEPLRQALARLKAGIARRRSISPQGK